MYKNQHVATIVLHRPSECDWCEAAASEVESYVQIIDADLSSVRVRKTDEEGQEHWAVCEPADADRTAVPMSGYRYLWGNYEETTPIYGEPVESAPGATLGPETPETGPEINPETGEVIVSMSLEEAALMAAYLQEGYRDSLDEATYHYQNGTGYEELAATSWSEATRAGTLLRRVQSGISTALDAKFGDDS